MEHGVSATAQHLDVDLGTERPATTGRSFTLLNVAMCTVGIGLVVTSLMAHPPSFVLGDIGVVTVSMGVFHVLARAAAKSRPGPTR